MFPLSQKKSQVKLRYVGGPSWAENSKELTVLKQCYVVPLYESLTTLGLSLTERTHL